jgi:putative ABC transport system permease protein
MPALRAVVRWAWRLFRREWRQQLLILALITVAVGATVVGSAVATNTPPPKTAGFGTARDSVSFASYNAHAAQVLARLRHEASPVQVIENETLTIPGSIETYNLRAENAHGPFSGPMLSLLAGRYPATAGEVAVTHGVATAFHLRIGSTWQVGGRQRRVVGFVENPQSLLDEFALVLPGQVRSPNDVTALFDARGSSLGSLGAKVQTPASVTQSNPINPETVSLAALILGMLLIALVSVGGFTVLAQRRLKAIGMLESIGATDRHVRMVVRANGAVVGVAGALFGFALGLVIWLGYRPSLEQSAHHLIGVLALPWTVVIAAMVLAVLATYFAAARPARAVTKVPIVTALSGRPAPPREIHRSALPGIICLLVAFILLGYAGGTGNGTGNGGTPELALGILLLIPGLILLAPFFLSLAARLAKPAPAAVRLALRDLARYRARSGSALAAISVGILVAVIVMLVAAARYGNVLDYAGPNLTASQLVVSGAGPPPGSVLVRRNAKGKLVKIGRAPSGPPPTTAELDAGATKIARDLGAELIALESPDASINATEGGRSWSGAFYVATPQLLRDFGIKQSEINPNAIILSSRPGLSGVSAMQLEYGSSGDSGGSSSGGTSHCSAATHCLAHPLVQYLGALPSGTSAPNTVITEHAMRELHLTATTSTWLVQAHHPFTATQISGAKLTASTAQLSVESKNDQPTSYAVIGWTTIFGMLIALSVLGMSVGLVRSETANDLRTLAATGASSFTRRTITAVTAGALGFLGAVLGVLGGYIGVMGWLSGNSLNGGISALGHVPLGNLLLILLGMPVFAALIGWLLAGREPPAMAHQAIE